MTDNIPGNIPDNIHEYQIHRHFVFVSSSLRDRDKYPMTTDFKIDLPKEYRDVISVELTAGNLPNLDSISDDAFLFLDVKDLNHIDTCENTDYFGILTLHKANSNNFFTLDKSSTNAMPITFRPPKQKLSNVYIKLFHPDKTPVDFGSEASNVSINQLIQTSFVFEIKTRILKRHPEMGQYTLNTI